jgi:transglutaminase-like putative cysteine protease
MNFSAYTTIITYLASAVGIGAMVLVEEVGNGFVTAMALVMGASLIINTTTTITVSKALWNVLAVVVFTVYLADYFFASGTFIGASARFLTILVALKLFDLTTTRDYFLLFTLVLFQILAAAASTVSPLFFLILSVFIMLSIWAMIIFNMKRDWEEGRRREGTIPRGVFGAPFFLGTIALTASSIIITLALFFIIPRLAVGFFEPKTLNTIKVAGFSDRVELGEFGPVKQNPMVVMRVELPQMPSRLPVLYFRGATLDHYDGRGWNRTVKKMLPAVEKSGRLFIFGKWQKGMLEQKILLEPLETEILFAVSRGVSVQGRFAKVLTDRSGSIYLPSPHYSRIQYWAWSVLGGPGKSPGKSIETYTPEAGSPYLQTPSRGSPVEALALEITKGKPTDFERAKAIEDYLKRNYRYTLDPEKGAGGTPLEDFLFYSKQGYCEHYATAMVILLRHAGIPARIVTGFLQGQWNGYGNYFLVRQQDAHSWVEAYIPARGWTRFDPTPSQGLTTPREASRVGLLIDSLRWRWAKHIINYTVTDQIRMARKIESRASGLRVSLGKFIASFLSAGREGKGPSWWMLLIPVLVTALLAAAIIKVVLTGRKGEVKTPEFYLEMLSILKKKGFEKRAFETPMEFALRTGHPVAKSLTRAFEEVRYGGRALTRAMTFEIESFMESLKKAAY